MTSIRTTEGDRKTGQAATEQAHQLRQERINHTRELTEIRDRQEQEKERMSRDYELKLNNDKVGFENSISNVRKKFEELIADENKRYEKILGDLKSVHDEKVAELQKNNISQLSEVERMRRDFIADYRKKAQEEKSKIK